MLKQYEPARPIDMAFHALGDPNRRSMVDQLSRGPASVSELAAPLGISLPAVVQHLHVLEAGGLVRSEKVGRVRTCHVQPAVMQEAERWISQRRAVWERRLDRLGDLLAELPDQSDKDKDKGEKHE